MQTFRSVRELRVALAGAPRPLGFVPTMGALHEGHSTLVRHCREACGTVVASVFVNPSQFGEGEDLDRYPRDLKTDARLLAELGTDVLFSPAASELYPDGFSTSIDVGPIASVYEGAVRPGHFAGVCTVVAKLFNIVGPDIAWFGQKDAQQLALIRKLVRDLDLDVAIEAVETVRDADGLALSSRNAGLAGDQRISALGISRGLFRAGEAWRAGEREPGALALLARFEGLDYDYCACVDPDSFADPAPGGPALLIVAARVGGIRLIDNLPLRA